MRIFLVLLMLVGSCQYLISEENFILIDGSSGEVIMEFGSNINDRVTPASSFKIPLSLMGYDTEVLQDEQNPTWDFQDGYDDFLELWKTSLNPQTWMNYSCVWYSKIIALQLGLERIEQYLSLFNYGNQDVSTGMVLPGPSNPLWVSSSLKISPYEQVIFIQKMIQEKLPISKKALQMTKNILLKEEIITGWKLYGKTGFGSSSNENGKVIVRWFVGWLQNEHNFYPFAYLLLDKEVDILKTVPRVKQLLKESNLYEKSQLFYDSHTLERSE